MSSIVLSAGERQNLLALHNTADLLSTTQTRLATGKKVNSALDNPVSYFTATGLNNRASDLNSLADSMSLAQQTLQAANNGITSISELVQSAKSVANQALQAPDTATNSYSSITGTQAIAADSVTKVSATTDVSTAGTASVQSSLSANWNWTALASGGDGATITITVGSTTKTFTHTLAPGSASAGTFSTFNEFIAAFNDPTAGFGGAGGSATASDQGGFIVMRSNDLTHDVVLGAHDPAFDATIPLDTRSIGDALTISTGSDTQTFYRVGSNASAANHTYTDAASLQAAIAASSLTSSGPVTATVNGTGVDITRADGGSLTFSGDMAVADGYATSAAGTSYSANFNPTLAAMGGNVTVQVGSNAVHTLTFGTGAGEIGSRAALNAALASFGDIDGSVDGSGHIKLTSTSAADVTIGGTAADLTALGLTAGTTTPTVTPGGTPNAVRAALETQYNTLLTQIDELAADAGYDGLNLLGGDNLNVTFSDNGSFTVNGVSDDAAGLGLSTLASGGFQANTDVNSTIDSLNTALSTLRAQASQFGSNLGLIQTRQSFTTDMVNTLQTGSNDLVLADSNQEGANLLALQTRQSLSTTALSLASQSDQAVLRLFG